jgi:putative nucleotidyltransferase with HDIG domain
MTRSILFVDDEKNILHALQRSLHAQRNEWNMYFAPSGPLALTVLEEDPIDVIVTDMRMPGMDGAELLEIVSRRFPNVIRIILSGHTDSEAALRTIHTAHQFLAKPCDVAILRQTIQRTCNLRDILHDPKLIRTITGICKLPSLPGSYLRLTQAMQSPDVSPKVIGDIISQDVSMTAKVLQLVNSAFFSLPTKITNPQRAVTLLGINTLKALILYNKVFSEYSPSRAVPGFSMEGLWQHSLMVGSLAREIMQREGGDPHLLDDVQVAGILHDIGKIIELNIPGYYAKFDSKVNREKKLPLDAEYELLGVSHAELGAYLIGIWGLPTNVVEAIAFHHNPAKQPNTGFSPMLCLHIANWVINQVTSLENDAKKHSLDLELIQATRLSGKMETWRALGEMVQRSYTSPAAMDQMKNH